MNESSQNDLVIETQIDSICDAFEKALRNGDAPEVLDFVGQLSAAQEYRQRLVSELVLLDLDYRIDRGESPAWKNTTFLRIYSKPSRTHLTEWAVRTKLCGMTHQWKWQLWRHRKKWK